jgi:uncharacterized protein YjbI with pentapeptide repeats
MASSPEQIQGLSEALKAQFDSWPKNIQDLVTIEDHDGAHRFSFKEKSLSGMSLMGINLQGVNLQGVNLCYAQLQGANLKETDMSGADAYGANLEDADVTGAKLDGITLEWAILAGVKGLWSGWRNNQGKQQPNTITICRDTVLPEGILNSFQSDGCIDPSFFETFLAANDQKPSNRQKTVSDFLTIKIEEKKFQEWQKQGIEAWKNYQTRFLAMLKEFNSTTMAASS